MFLESPSVKMEKYMKDYFLKKYSAIQIYVYDAIYCIIIFIRGNWSQILLDLAHNNDDWLIEYSSYITELL